jgi:hypothetical protein
VEETPMKGTTTLWLLALAILLGGLIWLGEREHQRKPAPGVRENRVIKFDPAVISDVTIEKGDVRLRLVRKDAAWYLVQPVQGRADSGEIDRILGIIETLPRHETITDEERRQRDLDLSDYGFAPPRARFILQGGSDRYEFLIGGDAPIGDMVYVKSAAGDDIASAPKDLLTLIPENVEKLRDRIILIGDAERTVRIEIQRPGSGAVQLVRGRSGWMIQQPVSLRADGSRVAKMLDAIYGLRAEKFVWDPPPTGQEAKPGEAPAELGAGARLETYGLAADTAQLRIQVWATGEQSGKELLIGKAVDETGTLVYAKRRDLAPIYAVPASATSAFSVGLNELRDRNLFPTEVQSMRYLLFQEGDRKLALQRDVKDQWNVVEPVQWKADDNFVNDIVLSLNRLRVDSVVEDADTNLTVFGLEPPAFSLVALEHAPTVQSNSAIEVKAPAGDGAAAEESPARLLVGQVLEGKTTAYVMVENSKTVLALAASSLSALRFPLTDPLIYRDRTMLAIPRSSVWKITLQKAGREQAVLRGETGGWSAASQPEATADDAVVSDVLGLVEKLRALRIENQGVKNLVTYGLDRTGIALTFSLSGKEGIQKTLILGFRARTDGIYATVQGQDVVFVLANSVAERLAADLLRANAVEQAAPGR